MKELALVGQVNEWAGIGMGSDGKFRVDSSALKSGYKCTTAATLRYIWGLVSKSERANLLAGTALHKALEVHLGGGAGALEAFDEVYKTWASQNVAADDKLSWQNTRLITQKWIEAHHITYETGVVQGWPFTIRGPEHIEIGFELPLTTAEDGTEILLLGRLDVLGDYQGGYVVVDHKSTGFINQQWFDQWPMDCSIDAYVWAARQLLDKPVLGAFINGVQFSKLPSDGTRKCKDHGTKYSECGPMHAKWELVGLYERNEAMLAGWKADADQMAQGLYKIYSLVGNDIDSYLDQLQQEGKFTGECRWCEYKKAVCEIGRRAGVARAQLEFAPWNPLEH